MSIEDGKVDDAETFLRKSVADVLLIVAHNLAAIVEYGLHADMLSGQIIEKLRANLREYGRNVYSDEWLDYIADSIIHDHDAGLSDNQIRVWLHGQIER